MPSLPLILIGYRGAGKSTIAQRLGERTGWPVISLDERIERQSRRRIAQWVQAEGWEPFRTLESRLLEEALGKEGGPRILDCGGGVVESEGNRRRLHEGGVVIWLRCARSTLAARLARDTIRPSLTGADPAGEIHEVLDRREPLYGETAHATVDVTGMNPDQAADRVWEAYLRHFNPPA